MMKLLIENGADVNAVAFRTQTALLLAVSHGKEESLTMHLC